MAAAEGWRVRPWLLVSGAWIVPAILGAIDAIAQRRLHAVIHLGMALLFCALWAGAGTLLRWLLMPEASTRCQQYADHTSSTASHRQPAATKRYRTALSVAGADTVILGPTPS